MLPPLPPVVVQAVFPMKQQVLKMYFRVAVRTIQQLQCSPPEGCRQSGYGCSSGDFVMLTSLALTKLESTGGKLDTELRDHAECLEPLHAVLDVKKHRTATRSIIDEAENRTTSAKRQAVIQRHWGKGQRPRFPGSQALVDFLNQ